MFSLVVAPACVLPYYRSRSFHLPVGGSQRSAWPRRALPSNEDVQRRNRSTSNLTMMKSLALSAVLVGFAIANVEKTIFIAPPSISIPRQHPNLDDLRLQKLSPEWTSIRTYLNASFPAPAAEKGSESWLLLDGLRPSQRYELRICWLATVRSSSRFSHPHHSWSTADRQTATDLVLDLYSHANRRFRLTTSVVFS